MQSPVIDAVAAIPPGQWLEVDARELEHHVPGFHHNGAFFSPADRVLENIVGSAYEYSYRVNGPRRTVTFMRRAEPLDDEFTYVSPDRRA